MEYEADPRRQVDIDGIVRVDREVRYAVAVEVASGRPVERPYGLNPRALITEAVDGRVLLGNRVFGLVLMDCLATEFKSPLKPVIDLP